METIKIRGIVIRSIDYKETSKIVYCFTNIGRLSIKAIGCKKFKNKNFNFNEQLNYVEMEITTDEFPSLIDFSIINRFDSIKTDIKSMLWFSYILEFINLIPPDIPYEKTLDFFIRLFNKKENPMLVAMLIQVKCLALFGLKPEFNHCMICNSTDVYKLSVNLGGALCKNHQSDIDFNNLDDIKRLYYFNDKTEDMTNLSDIDLFGVFNFVTAYYKYHEDISLKSQNSLLL